MSKPGYVNEDYRTWLTTEVTVGSRPVTVASKPGVFSHGDVDVSSLLLAQHARARAGEVFVAMNCGNGLTGAAVALAEHAARVILTDRNVLGVMAASRTMSANDIQTATIHLGHGSHGLPTGLVADAVAVRIPHEKAALVQLLHDAFTMLRPGGHCHVAGATNEGIKSAARMVEEVFGNVVTIATERGHRVVRATRFAGSPASMRDANAEYLRHDAFREQRFVLRGATHEFWSRPGVFSWDHLDEATAILVEQMAILPGDRVLDLGCGYGVLGVVAGSVAPAQSVTMLDADSEAVRSAERSARSAGLANARAIVSDIASAVLDEQFDVVVTNPPFHVGKSTDLSVPIQFIHDAWKVLAPGGRLQLVANRTLPYEGAIKFLFRNMEKAHDGRRFKVLTAVKGDT